ncbi:MAG: hypothetical protein WC357_02895 [Candidatus Omnitrophota bacterium]|jgi:uncharacterized protein (DUF1778 family)
MVKENYVQIRVTDEEKKEIQEAAKKQGFDNISAFILWLFRKFGKS